MIPRKSPPYLFIVVCIVVGYLLFQGRLDPYLDRLGLGKPTPTQEIVQHSIAASATPVPTLAPGATRDNQLDEQLATAAAATQEAAKQAARDQGTPIPTNTPEPTLAPNEPSPTPQPIVVILNGDAMAARQIFESSRVIFPDRVVEAGAVDGIEYGESIDTLVFSGVNFGPKLFQATVNNLGQSILSTVPDQEERIGVQGHFRVVAGMRFDDLLPADVVIGEPEEVPCDPGKVQNAENVVCKASPLQVTLNVNICHTVPQISRDLQIVHVDRAGFKAMVASKVIGDGYQTSINGANIAWLDFFDRVMSQENLLKSGGAAEANVSAGDLYQALLKIYQTGGWKSVDLKVNIVNDWRNQPINCTDLSPIEVRR